MLSVFSIILVEYKDVTKIDKGKSANIGRSTSLTTAWNVAGASNDPKINKYLPLEEPKWRSEGSRWGFRLKVVARQDINGIEDTRAPCAVSS